MSADPYTFEHEGHVVCYARGTTLTGMEATRIRRKLILALYGEVDEIPSDEYNNIDEYTSGISRCTTDAPWWCHSNMSGEQIKARFEAYSQEDETLYQKLQEAHLATHPPKKTILTT